MKSPTSFLADLPSHARGGRMAKGSSLSFWLGLLLMVAVCSAAQRSQAQATFNFSTTAPYVGPAAGTSTIIISAPTQATTWLASSAATWLHITLANSTGTGNGTLEYNYDANTGATRSGYMFIQGVPILVTQAGTGYQRTSAALPVPKLAANYNGPQGLASDSSGNIYICDHANMLIKKWMPSIHTNMYLVVGLTGPQGIATDSSGNLYITDSDNQVKKYTAASGLLSILIPANKGLKNPTGIVVGTNGNLYIADTGNNAIKMYNPTTATLSTVLNNLSAPMGITTDVAGNLYFTNSGNGLIWFVSAKTGKWTSFKLKFSSGATTITTPTAIAVDEFQNMYVTDSDSNANRIWKIDFQQLAAFVPELLTDGASNTSWTLTDVALSTFIGGLNGPMGITIDPTQTMYYSDTGNNLVYERPFAFVNPTAVAVPNATASYALPPVLPTTVDINLNSVFYPTSNQSWLTISSVSLGLVRYLVTSHVGAPRTASISLLGTTINVTEAVGNAAPLFTSAASTTFTEGVSGSFNVTTSGYPAPAYSYSGTLPSNVTFDTSTGILSGIPDPGTHGKYTIDITAANGILPNAGQVFVLTVGTPPSINSATSTTFNTSVPGSFQVTASGFPTSTFTETGTLPKNVTFTAAGLLSGTPAAGTGGLYPISITAANGATPSDVQSFNLQVNQPVVITSANKATFLVGQASTFKVTATGYPTPIVTQTGGTLPTGLNFNNGVISGTPAAGTGASYPLQFTVTNGAGSTVVQGFTLTVNQPPAITSVNSLALTVGTPVTFNVTATGFPVPTITQSGAMPPGLSFSNGLLKGTPGAGAVGTYSWLITAKNGVGTNATQIFTISVKGAPTTTALTQILPAGHAVSGQTVSLYAVVTPTYTAFPTGTVTFIMDGQTKLSPAVSLGNVSGKATAVYASTTLPPGQHNFTATYNGSTTYASSTATTALPYLVEPKLSALHVFSAQKTPLSTNGTNTDGASPACQLLQASNGLLYGATQLGGAGNAGTVFSLSTTGTFTNLHSFTRLTGTTNADGSNPYGGLTFGNLGGLFATAPHGGANGLGVIYNLMPNSSGSTFTFATSPFYTFGANAGDGSAPYSKFTVGADGNLYGVTSAGGANGTGSIFMIQGDGTVATLYSFTALSGGINTEGATPISELTLGSDGYLYGVATAGGANGGGTIFVFTPGPTVTPLHSFSAAGVSADGNTPSGALTVALDGNFYGVCSGGGANSNGTIYTITPVGQGGNFTALYSFSAFTGKSTVLALGTNMDGASPNGVLVQNSGGTFYGVTKAGGYGGTGVVYSLETDGTVNGTEQNLIYNFSAFTSASGSNGINPEGAQPVAGLLFGADGKLYGTALTGGAYGAGTVFSVQPPPTWHVLATSVGNLADGAREGAAHSTANEYFYKGTDGNLWGATPSGTNQWTTNRLTSLPGTSLIADWLVWDPVYTQVYWQGTDNNIWCYLWSNGGVIENLTPTTSNVAGNVTLHPLNSSATLQLLNYRSTDNRIWALNGNKATNVLFQQPLIAGGTDNPNVAGDLTVDDVNHFVYYRDVTNNIWCYYLAGSTWTQLQLTNSGKVAGGVTADSNLTVYYRATDNSAWKVYFDGSNWQNVQIDPNADMGPATPVLYAPQTLLYLDVEGMLQMLDMTGSVWSNSALVWQTFLSGGLAPSAPAYQEIFGRRPDGTFMVYYLK